MRHASGLAMGWALGLILATAAAAPARGQAEDQLDPLTRNGGQPFFPVGAYSLPGAGAISIQEAVSNGWTMTRYHLPSGYITDATPGNPDDDRLKVRGVYTGEIIYTTEENLSQAKNEIYDGYLDEADGTGLSSIIYTQDLILADDRQGYEDRLNALKDHESFQGFYLMDEPENHAISYDGPIRDDFETWLDDHGYPMQGRAQHLQQFLQERMGWAKTRFNQVDPNPDHYTVNLLGWNDHYKQLHGLSDVISANAYPRWETDNGNLVDGDLARVAWDARNAGEAAATAGGGQGFIYTPLALDQHGSIPSPPEKVVRYTFFAPITQGAMGIVSWAGYRNSASYARNEVFPVTRDVSELSEFFLGDWLDDKLSWTPTDRGHEDLEEYDLPRVSAILRRAEDGRLLLLAVNNTAEETDATFTLDADVVSELEYVELTEVMEGESMALAMEDGRRIIEDHLGPYGVKGYVLAPEPASAALLGLGGLVLLRRRRRT